MDAKCKLVRPNRRHDFFFASARIRVWSVDVTTRVTLSIDLYVLIVGRVVGWWGNSRLMIRDGYGTVAAVASG